MTTKDPQTGRTSETAPGRRFRRLWPTAVVVVLLGVTGLLFFRIQSEGEVIRESNQAGLRPDREAVNVVALKLIPATMRDRLVLPGVTKPWIELKILAEVNGRVTRKVLADGAVVVAGQPIAGVDPRDFRNAHLSAKAAFDLALSDFERLTNLYNRKAIPRSQLDGARAKVETSRATMNSAALDVERCTISAPFDGVVNRVLVEEGQYLKVGDPVAEVLQMQRLKVQVGIPESDVEAVRGLERFQLTVDALNRRRFLADKHFLSRIADPSARLYSLELSLDNTDGAVLPDMFVRVEIVKKEVAQSLSVPLYAVVNRSDGQVVYVVEDETARARPVTIGLLDGWRVEVTGGLQPSEQVIIVGHRSVNDGDPVRVIRSVDDPEEIVQ